MTKKASEPKVKCPGCHAYYVEKGEVCNNCQIKAAKKPKKDDEE